MASDQIVIVGAGPGGCAAAIALARRGFRNVTLLDRARFPREKTCGSAISPLGLRVLAELGVEDEVRRRGYTIHSLLLTTPGGRTLRLRGGEAALVLLRKDFDQLLVDCAQSLGVRFRDGVQVTALACEERARHRRSHWRRSHAGRLRDLRRRRPLAVLPGHTAEARARDDHGLVGAVRVRAGDDRDDLRSNALPALRLDVSGNGVRINIGIVVDDERAGSGGALGKSALRVRRLSSTPLWRSPS